jgi:putative addiction module component (TIGR02574 family)
LSGGGDASETGLWREVQALSTREKLELADELWQDAAHDLDSLEVSASERKLLDERWAAYLRNPSSALTLEQFKAKVKKRRA